MLVGYIMEFTVIGGALSDYERIFLESLKQILTAIGMSQIDYKNYSNVLYIIKSAIIKGLNVHEGHGLKCWEEFCSNDLIVAYTEQIKSQENCIKISGLGYNYGQYLRRCPTIISGSNLDKKRNELVSQIESVYGKGIFKSFDLIQTYKV